jgi:hypothetical protein
MSLIWIIPAEGSGIGLPRHPTTMQAATLLLRVVAFLYIREFAGTDQEVRHVDPPKLVVQGVTKVYRDGRFSGWCVYLEPCPHFSLDCVLPRHIA